MTTSKHYRPGLLARGRAVLIAGLVAAIAVLTVSATTTSNAATVRGDMAAMTMNHPTSARQAALYTAMRELWAQHMEWTYATVSDFVDGSPGLTPTLKRLLRNQKDIGNAIKPFYGKAAGKKLTKLLRTHILDAVPVLTAAKDGDTAALDTAVKAWYANAKKIGKFLARANPHWSKKAMKKMMKKHITQTIAYASDQLTGHYALSIKDYGSAEAHMMRMSDMLSAGIIKQFPRKFR